MQTPEQILAKQGVPINSSLKAGIYINQTDRTEEMYRKSLNEILGIELPVFVDAKNAKLTYAYFAQEYLKLYLSGQIVDVESLYAHAKRKAETLINSQPYHWATSEEDGSDVKYSDDGSVKRKKGWKRDRAFELYQQNPNASKKEIMDIFKKELGMSHSGAQTYYYNAKKEFDT